MDEPTKPCRRCREVLPLLDFPKLSASRDGHHSWCFNCKRAAERKYGKTYRDRDPERMRRNKRRYVRKDDVRAARAVKAIQEKWGLTPEAFAAKLAAQGGHCPFCPPGSVPKVWDVDHDHRCCPGPWSCGRCLRDILCRKHNRGLGDWDDDPELLRAAADYIERHRGRIAASAAPPRVKAAKRGEGHQAWKGDAVQPGALRLRMYRAKGSASECVNRETAGCTSERYEWVLTPGADPADADNYVSLCASCRMTQYGRQGGGHHNARLTDEQAQAIRERYAAGGVSQTALAAEFGISQATVSTVIRGTAYKKAG